MFPRTVGKHPLNIKLGSQRVKVAYIDHRPDGSDILIPRISKTQFHVSFHPDMIHISDNQGLNLRLDLFSVANEGDLAAEFAGFLEGLLDSVELNPEFDEDLFAFPDPTARFARLWRRSKFGIDVDVLGALKSNASLLPICTVEEEAIDSYLQTYGERAGLLFGIDSRRAYLVTDASTVVGLEIDVEDMCGIARRMPFGQTFMDAFVLISEHMQVLEEESDFSPYGLLEEEFLGIDRAKLVGDVESALADFQPPYFKKYTNEGFVPTEAF